jgi:hypothetical protein
MTDRDNELINLEDVCRTAPATPGLYYTVQRSMEFQVLIPLASEDTCNFESICSLRSQP